MVPTVLRFVLGAFGWTANASTAPTARRKTLTPIPTFAPFRVFSPGLPERTLPLNGHGEVASTTPRRLEGFAAAGHGHAPRMRRTSGNDDEMAVLAVLAAAAREAEELIADDQTADPDALDEANRRLELFMHAARRTAR
jgi:hypothetical protein